MKDEENKKDMQALKAEQQKKAEDKAKFLGENIHDAGGHRLEGKVELGAFFRHQQSKQQASAGPNVAEANPEVTPSDEIAKKFNDVLSQLVRYTGGLMMRDAAPTPHKVYGAKISTVLAEIRSRGMSRAAEIEAKHEQASDSGNHHRPIS